MVTSYSNWKVGDVLRVCASVYDFCGQYTQCIRIDDINVDKSPNCSITGTTPTCKQISNIGVTFKIVGITGTTAEDTCSPQKIYKNLGEHFTNNQGIVVFEYNNVTEQDRLDYLDAISLGYNYKIIACITNDAGQGVCTGGSGVPFGGSKTTDPIIVAINPCTGITCPNVCVGYDLYSQKCIDGNCTLDQLIGHNDPTCMTTEVYSEHILHFKISKMYPDWFVNGLLDYIKYIAGFIIKDYPLFYIDHVEFDSDKYILSLDYKRRVSLGPWDTFDPFILLGPAYLAYKLIKWLLEFLFVDYLGAKSVKNEVPTVRIIRIIPKLCTSDASGNLNCVNPTIPITVKYCVEKDCQEKKITDGNPISIQTPSDISIEITVQTDGDNYSVYHETVPAGTSEYIINANLQPKAGAKIVPSAKYTDGTYLICGKYILYETANDGTKVQVAYGDLNNGVGPTINVNANVEACVSIIPCELHNDKVEQKCYTPIAGQTVEAEVIIKKCPETKNSITVTTIYEAIDLVLKGFTADLIEIKAGNTVIKSVTPTTNITFVDGLDKNVAYTVHVTKAGYIFINNDQVTQFTTDCMSNTPMDIKANAPPNTRDVTITVTSCQSTSPIQSVNIILDNEPAKKTNNVGQVLFTALPDGNHTVKITYAGYEDENFTIVVDATHTVFSKCLTVSQPVGTIDTRIVNFNAKGLSAGSGATFDGSLEYKDTDSSWKKLTDAEIIVTIKGTDGQILKVLTTTTKAGLLDSGYFETTAWAIPSNLSNVNIDVISTFQGIGNYKPSSVSQSFYIGTACFIKNPISGGCLMSQTTATVIVVVLVAGISYGIYRSMKK